MVDTEMALPAVSAEAEQLTSSTNRPTRLDPAPQCESPQYPLVLQLTQTQVICPAPFTSAFPGKDEDCICCTTLAGQWPVLIVADGASATRDAHSGHLHHGGGQAAAVAVETARAFLDTALQAPASPVHTVLHLLRDVYTRCQQALAAADLQAGTTLLLALLYELHPPLGQGIWWFYAFEGDGAIVVLNPQRQLDGRLLRTELLVPGQKIDTTATVLPQRCLVPPVVGCLAYEPGDILYVASDGMEAVSRALYHTQATFLANYLYEHGHAHPNTLALQELFAPFVLSDDAVLGLMWTQGKQG